VTVVDGGFRKVGGKKKGKKNKKGRQFHCRRAALMRGCSAGGAEEQPD
jgi:hypothetical protein